MRGRKTRFALTTKLFALFVLCMITTMASASTGGDPIKTVLTTIAISPVAILGKEEKDLTAEEKGALVAMEKVTNEVLKEFKNGVIDKSTFDTKMAEIQNQLKELSPDGKLGKTISEIETIRDTIKGLADTIEGLKGKGFNFGAEDNIEKQLDEIIDSDKFKEFTNRQGIKSTGKFTLDLKELTSFENSYTGNKLITNQSNVVVSKVAENRVDLRDLMMVDNGDPTFTNITFSQITSLDRNAAFLSENGRLPKSAVKMKEVTYEVKRVGTYLPISKRLLRSRQYIKNFIMTRLPKWVRMAENFQIMFGDGTGDNLLGIAKHPEVKCVSSIISDSVYAGEAGTVKYVNTYDGGKNTMIEFKDPVDAISTGQMIIFAGEITGEFEITKINDRRIMIEKSFSSIAEDKIAALTFTVKNNFFNKVQDPNMKDAINAIFAVLSYAEYNPNGIVLNTSTIFEISTAKDTTGRDLNLIQVVNGVSYIGGRPIIASNDVKPGYYFAGDLQNGASIIQNSAISIEVVEDLESKLTNMSNIMIDEEIMMPVYNPWAFAYGKLDDVLNAIKKS